MSNAKTDTQAAANPNDMPYGKAAPSQLTQCASATPVGSRSPS